MAAFETLRALLAHLLRAEIVPRPEDEDWPSMIARISAPGTIAEIDVEVYWYFLEVLPPKFMGTGVFAFAEGAEPLRIFWRCCVQHFCRQLTWGETSEFCRLASIPLPS